MVDQILLSASDRNIQACVVLAREYGLGIEVMAFAFPNFLDGDRPSALARYRKLLAPVPGNISMHGPFMDMAPGSPDSRVNQVCIDRYHDALDIASELHIPLIVFHANFIGAIHNIEYRDGWQQRNLEFWGQMTDYAARRGVTIAVENMWEFDPDIIGDLLKKINHPNLRACLDVGHAHLFGDVPFEEWLTSLGDYIVHIHANNNDGKIDIHMGFDQGVLNYRVVLDEIRALAHPPEIVLEMDEVDFMRASLPYFHLG
ncbi:MAG: sugar phosphate isomerase/epimerase family protein [Anaerolineae bacterium]